ncbi:MAG: 1,4-dihydroxy-2-naphthoate polyprenyltransferase [Bacteroidetes bacterium]|nr:MAG: 1,4-dihydroxy-2-naphthoate polyprenyltransferase [Bacteroidota bacterium]
MIRQITLWLSAFRLRTLPLSLASILMGSFLANRLLDWRIFTLSILTTIFLQILSNLANDYGDSIHGADSSERKVAQRAVQSGKITAEQMKKAVILFAILSFLSGMALLVVAIQNLATFLFFLTLGIFAIFAAIAYTNGKRPYGYAGLGDISVMIFFGWVAVFGTYFLHTQSIDFQIFMPAFTCGFFATAVLNVNNIRDIETDQKAGKISIPVRLGREKAVIYHWFLLVSGMLCTVIYTFLHFESVWQFLFILSFPLILKNGFAVQNIKDSAKLDPYLKQMAISTLLFVLSFGAGMWIRLL